MIGTGRWTYVVFNKWAHRIPRQRTRRGYGRGDPVGILARNRAEFLAPLAGVRTRLSALCEAIVLPDLG